MCTATAAQVILDTLAQMTKDGKIFTAYDVTVEARKQTRENIRHNDVRRIVSQEFLTNQFPANYLREMELLETDNGNQEVNVFFPDDKSSSDHPKAVTKISNSSPVPSVPVSNHAPVSSHSCSCSVASPNNNSIFFVDCESTKEGRINVPKGIVDLATPSNGLYDIDLVKYIASGRLVRQMPNKDGRLRINKKLVGNGLGTKFRVSYIANANIICIEQV